VSPVARTPGLRVVDQNRGAHPVVRAALRRARSRSAGVPDTTCLLRRVGR
jgi:hypothetical protein